MGSIRRWTRVLTLAVVAVMMACGPRGGREEHVQVAEGLRASLNCERPRGEPGRGKMGRWLPKKVKARNAQVHFPRKGLPAGTEITLAPIDSPQVAFRLTLVPDPGKFSPADLIIDLAGCPGPPTAWQIWRHPDPEDTDTIPMRLETDHNGNKLTATIEDNSFFIIAN